MSATSITLRGRAAAERDMLDAVTVQHQTSVSTDQETGVVTPVYATVYTGKAKIQQAAPASTPTVIGEASVFIGPMTLHLPVTTTTAAVGPDDLATVTTCVLDPSLAGQTFRLRGPAHKSYATARRFPMVEVDG